MNGEHWIHVLPVGDVYSARHGSSIPTVAAALSARHIAAGGTVSVVAAAGLPHEPRGAHLITYDSPRQGLPAGAAWADAASAALGRGRPRLERLLTPVVTAIPEDADGPVFLHNAPAAVPVLRRLRPCARPVLYLHNDLFLSYGRRERTELVRSVDVVVSVSRWTRDRLTRGLPEPLRREPKQALVVNGADESGFRPREAGAVDDPGRPPTVLFAGRTVRAKGPHLLVRACRRLAADGVALRLVVVGNATLDPDGKASAYDRRLRRAAGPLGGSVEFVPFADRERMGELFREADVCVVPSLWPEPCGLALVEALATGCASVASTRGALPEVGSGAASLFRPGRPGDLERCLGALLRDPAVRRSAAERARRRGAQLGWDSRYLALLAAVTAATRVPALPPGGR